MSDLSTEIKEIEKALTNICSDWVGIGIQMADARRALLELKRLESIRVPPERKQGHWIVHNEYSTKPVECSECGMLRPSRSKFCQDCGALMVD